MDRATAIKKLGKLLGKNMGYRVDPKAPTQDERDEVRAVIYDEIAKRDAIRKQRDERSKAILAADTEYQRLAAESRAASDHVAKLSGALHHYKFTAGTCSGMFFRVEAQGDSWEQVIAELSSKRNPKESST